MALYIRTRQDISDASRIERMTDYEFDLRQTVFKRAANALIATCDKYLSNHYGPKGIGFHNKRFGKMMELLELLDMNSAFKYAGTVTMT
jgi:hypothetical protein